MATNPEWGRAVPWARANLESGLGRDATGSTPGGLALPPEFEAKRGAFVTLKRHPSGDLRGCIGYPLPVLPLRVAVARAALAAATEDPRFRPVRFDELARLTVEVSVLTLPQPVEAVRPLDRLAAVAVGRDGLLVEGFGSSGLLLPQVAPEQGWTAEELLEGTCAKAGLPSDSWRDPRVRVSRFEADVYAETAPGGDVVRVPTGA